MGPVKSKSEGTAVFQRKKAKHASPQRGQSTQEPGSQNDSVTHVDLVTQEPPRQSEGADSPISKTISDTAQEGLDSVNLTLSNIQGKSMLIRST